MQDHRFLFAVIVAGTIVGLAGTDLVLPAVPLLPEFIKGTLTQAQLVLAAFAGGTAIGLLAFGELGARFNQKRLLVFALTGYGLLSFAASMSRTIQELVLLRFFQGLFAAAPAVFAPGMIRALFNDRQSLRALGLMGSIESVVPALAPVLGAWLLTFFDWRISFYITAVLALLLGATWAATPPIEATTTRKSREGYLVLLKSPVFLRYSLSQACTLGGLLVFVFGAPTVMTVAMGGTMRDFVTMQIIGISLFICASNTVHFVVDRIGPEKTIFAGSALAAFGAIAIVAYSLLTSHHRAEWLWFLFAFVNLGLGFRGPPGFYLAVVASGDNDSRGAALVMLMVFMTTALGTAALAPFITIGLVPLAITAGIIIVMSIIILALLPALPMEEETQAN
ncbi:MAG: MFS transporter [Pseudomonadales bacterium]|jgi:DHA1 family bicyclomycin/chloramphenicol resistance-like MFS transporter|nr:MFS transporter [Pseudomonadales bacterium]